MVTIRKASGDDFERIYPLLLKFKNPYIRKNRWSQLFVDHWGENLGHFGYVMMDGDDAVGFLGLLCSRRNAGGRDHRFCNLTSWIVREPYRGRSLFLLLPALKERGSVSFSRSQPADRTARCSSIPLSWSLRWIPKA
jgi:hypothetical protein